MNRITLLVRSILAGGSLLLLALSAIACSEPAPAGVAPVEPQYVDLFACNVALSCPMYCSHLGVEECTGAFNPPTCAGELWLAGKAGAIMLQDRPGPGSWMGDELTLLLGDGKALVQKRERSCPEGGVGCNFESIPWVLGPQELCAVKTPPTNCVPGDCPQLPSVENCVEVDKEWACVDAKGATSPQP